LNDYRRRLAAAPTSPIRRAPTALATAVLSGIGCGCAGRPSILNIADYGDLGQVRQYRESFDEGFYDVDAAGNVHIVLRRVQPSDDQHDHPLTQVIRIQSVWRSLPGRTVDHPTHLNGTVSYYILSGGEGGAFEGAGSVYFAENRGHTELRGTLDRAALAPKRQLSGGPPLFEKTELAGRFRAKRDPRQVVRVVHDMDRLFGLRPDMDTLSLNPTSRPR
jgi:hypothetical protein